tara:strand:- start:243 stop:524 length:282 start_codon:yes stop_codon:yes gene_type:complete
MALTKTTADDKIEIVSSFKHLQIRTATTIKEDGKVISQSFHRRTLQCGTIDSSDNFIDTDISGESDEVKNIANAVWTQAVKDAFKAKLIANKG